MGGVLSVAGVERARDAVLLALHTRFSGDDDAAPLSTRARAAFERVDHARRGWIASPRLDGVLASPRLDGVLAELGLAGRWDRRHVDRFASCFTLDDDAESGDVAARTSSRLDYLAFLDVVFYPIQVSRDTAQLKITQQAVVSAGGWMVHDGEYAGRSVAVKEVVLDGSWDDNNDRDEAVASLRRRVNALRLESHPNLVRYVCTVQTATSLYVVQQAHPSCSLKTILESFGPMKEATIRRYVCQILEATRYLHTNDIVHGNLHLESIHIDSSGQLKLSDFGACGEYRSLLRTESSSRPGFCGDWIERFQPPEQAKTKAADIWAIGVLILQMIHGVGKEAERALGEASNATKKSPSPAAGTPPPIPTSMSKSLRNVVQGCLQRRVRGRLTIDQVCEHEFFQVDPARATSEMLRDVCSDLDESMQRLTSSRSPSSTSKSGTRAATTRQSAPQVRTMPERPLPTNKQR